MNSFKLTGVGTLTRNPEIIAQGDTALVRFCLAGRDHAGNDDAGRPQELVTTAYFVAFDTIADDIARNSRQGDQLIVEARISHCWVDSRAARHRASTFIVTGFQYGAKAPRGDSSDTPSGCMTPLRPSPMDEAVGHG